MTLDGALAMAKGAATLVPGAYSLFGARRTNAMPVLPEYFYGVWFKHLSLLNEATGCCVPETVVELGPGDTIGVGIAALLSGANRYVGIDARPYASISDNDAVAARLIDMFTARASFVPQGWPDFSHLLDEHAFPSRVLDEERLSASLTPERLARIRDAVHRAFRGEETEMVSYRAHVPDDSADLVLSHSVLEHVADLPSAIADTFRWLKPGGYASHQFDLRSHNIVPTWDGHREFGRVAWRMVLGGRKFLINRLPFSRVVQCFEEVGFVVMRAERQIRNTQLPRDRLCREWIAVSDDDLRTEGGYIVARKPT